MAAEQITAPQLDTESVIRAIEALPLTERLRVLEAVARSVREEVAPTPAASTEQESATSDEEDWEAVRAHLLAGVPPESSAHRLLGAFRGTGPIAMTPEEERAIVEEALTKKYGQ